MQEGLSAELDGEDPGISRDLMNAHLDKCASCQAWSASASAIHRRLRVSAATDIPDLTPAILAAIGRDDRQPQSTNPGKQACRFILACCGFLQLTAALPVFLGADTGPVHLDHELGSWDIALALGLLFAALRPERSWGMLPLVSAIVAMLTTTAVIDATSGHTSFSGESTHLLELVGLFFLWSLARLSRQSGGNPFQTRLTTA